MGKSQPQLPINHLHHQNLNGSSFFLRCSRGYSRFARFFSFKCLFIFLLSLSVSLSAVFSLLHFHHPQLGFDASFSIKTSATVQAYFKLEKPVSFLIPQILKLEHDINEEIGVPDTQVVILSMHKSSAFNFTNVVFGFVSKPINTPINPVSLSVLRSSLIDLFSQRSNLTLTRSVFGTPSSFEILKFPGGITIIPKLSPPVWMLPQVLFNFTLRNSLHDIEENFLELKEQLKSGLQLMPYESVFVQVTNKGGSTREPPVTVQASVVSNIGSVDLERLKELGAEIRGSPPAKNLGLDNSVFGKVKEISLSSYLYYTLDAPSPSPSPNDHMGPTISPSSPSHDNEALPPVSKAPTPTTGPYCGGSNTSPGPSPSPSDDARAPRPVYTTPPNLSPMPAVSYGSAPSKENGNRKGLAPSPLSLLPSSSPSSTGVFHGIICSLVLILITLHIIV